MGMNNTWTEAHITTENRDRPGGHGYTFATNGMGYNEPHSAKSARFLKRKQRRSQRREHARITREAIQNFYEDQEFDVLDAIDMEDDYNDHFHEYEYGQDYDDCDDYDFPKDYFFDEDDYSYYDPFKEDFFFDPYDDAYDRFYAYTRQEDPHDRIIKHEDIGKSLGDLLQEIIDRRENEK